MDSDTFFTSEFDRHNAVVAPTADATRVPFGKLVFACLRSIRDGGKIVFFGNGGSAADAQHLATELTVRYTDHRAPIAAIALTTDTSALTAAGNDLGFDTIFARQVAALCQPRDVAIGLSTSGTSVNVIKGLEQAKSMGCTVAGMSGRDGGRLKGLAEPLLIVPSDSTPRIQEMHILLGHMLCGALEQELNLL